MEEKLSMEVTKAKHIGNGLKLPHKMNSKKLIRKNWTIAAKMGVVITVIFESMFCEICDGTVMLTHRANIHTMTARPVCNHSKIL